MEWIYNCKNVIGAHELSSLPDFGTYENLSEHSRSERLSSRKLCNTNTI